MSELFRVSHSKIGSWNRCKLAWDLSYVGKWQPQQKSYPLRLGSLVHELLEDYYQGRLLYETGEYEGPYDATQRHLQKCQVYSQSLTDSDDLTAFSQAANLVKRYIEEYSVYEDSPYSVVATEKHYEVELTSPKGRPFIFELYFDLLLQHKEHGKLWMVDHKTHNARPYTETQVLMDQQLPAYAMVMREVMNVNIFGLIYNLLNTYDYKKPAPADKLFTRKQTYRTPQELDSIIQEIGLAADEMMDYLESGTPRRSLTRDCDWCNFQEPCLMGMKGFDMEIFLQEGFEKKPERPRVEEAQSE